MQHAASAITLATLLAATVALPAQADPSVEVGVLNCNVSGGAGFVFGSSKRLDCVFKQGGRRDHYSGQINKYGLDIGGTKAGVISWAVFAPTERVGKGALAGEYGGVSGEATVGVGLGANALVGGSRRSFALQPLSVGAQKGLNFALGIASMRLTSSN